MAKRVSTTASHSQIKPAAIAKFHTNLAAWYAAHGRHDLPWRTTADPYHIWLSEVMLQQTQVTTVRDRFYFPFLEKFPTVEVLAAAPREAVMKAWEGLGYYRRAGFLHEAAKQIINLQSPVFSKNGIIKASAANTQKPKTDTFLQATEGGRLQTLLSLPGIGRNTASAILAFAYHQPVAILEANVKRIIARVFAIENPSEAQLWEGAELLLNRNTPFDYNQAMMDIGSMICTPKHPRCRECPANIICKGKSSPERYPAPKAKKTVPTREVIIHVHEDRHERLFLEKREDALLGGLYGFPQVPRTPSPVISKKNTVKKSSLPHDDWRPTTGHYIGIITHTYSHFKLIGHVTYKNITAKTNSSDWYSHREIAALPLSKLDHKVLALVENYHKVKKKL